MPKTTPSRKPVHYNPDTIRAWLLARGFRQVTLAVDTGADGEWTNYQLDNDPEDPDMWDYRVRVGVKSFHHPLSEIREPFWVTSSEPTRGSAMPMRPRTVAQFQAAIVTLLLVGAEGA